MERNYQFDYAKLFLIYCVIVNHLINWFGDSEGIMHGLQFSIHLFTMPAFILIAGLFSKRIIREKLWNRIVPYILLYIFMTTLTYIVNGIVSGFENTKLDFFNTTNVPWFAMSMFWFYLITLLVRKVHPAYVLTVSILVSLISGYSETIGSFLSIQRTIVFFPFFYLGYMIDPDSIKKFSAWYYKVLSFVIIAAAFIVSCLYSSDLEFWRPLFKGNVPYMSFEGQHYIAWGWSWRLLAYIISLILTFAVIVVMPSKKSLIAALGKKTLSVYVFHMSVMRLAMHFIPGFRAWFRSSHVTVNVLVFAVIVLLFTSLPVFEWIVNRIMNVPMIRKQ